MAGVTIHGMAQSTYVRTCRMVCEEKGIGYERRDAAPHSPELLRYNPTGKMPGFQHGDLVLWETSAIVRYLDDTFGGTRLQPADPVVRARMSCWISMVNDSFYQTMIRDIVLPRDLSCRGDAHVSKHQDPAQLQTAGDGPGDPGIGPAVRAQAQRLQPTLQSQRARLQPGRGPGGASGA
jgi:glutathione S-transferase